MFTFLFLAAAVAPQEQVVENEKPVLQLFYTPTCPYSRQVLNYLARIHKKVPLCNVQESPMCKRDLEKKGGLMMVPCLLIDGKPLYDHNQILIWLSTHKDLLEAES